MRCKASCAVPGAPWVTALRTRLSTAWRTKVGEASTVTGSTATGTPWVAPTSRHIAARSTVPRSRTCTLASCSSEDTVAALRALTSRIWATAGRRSASSPLKATSATVWMVAIGVFNSWEAFNPLGRAQWTLRPWGRSCVSSERIVG